MIQNKNGEKSPPENGAVAGSACNGSELSYLQVFPTKNESLFERILVSRQVKLFSPTHQSNRHPGTILTLLSDQVLHIPAVLKSKLTFRSEQPDFMKS